ncbi:MAG: type II toxin-antitoxin system RelE/ParE family toxin [Burkholderiales bacterium]
MALSLVWSAEAIEDIESIAAYIERDSPWYAKAVVSKIFETAETIPSFPDLGRIVPELGETAIRERFVYSYRIIYLLEAERVHEANAC